MANEYKITKEEWYKRMGVAPEEIDDKLFELATDGTTEALCTEGCIVEPDGHCPHGCPSLLLELELI